ncbi:hypothetical protein Bbelb_371200 [Xyrichtys novacula]|uniref:Uncharacterized protein n=1 Tax=Xyrichtys novacula TaxID=13765 RepID=A0AAV1GTC3_XYRNO|nr:hypothetical protein Bbelb_371200 [Xyrichtys novacula]
MTVAQHQHRPLLTIAEHDIEHVENFTNLGSNISNTGDLEKDEQTRIGQAAGVFKRLRNIWSSKSITTATKLRLYMSLVIPTATYACETWTKTASITNELDVLHRRCLRSILKSPLSDIVSDRRKIMTGHVLRLPTERDRQVWQ